METNIFSKKEQLKEMWKLKSKITGKLSPMLVSNRGSEGSPSN